MTGDRQFCNSLLHRSLPTNNRFFGARGHSDTSAGVQQFAIPISKSILLFFSFSQELINFNFFCFCFVLNLKRIYGRVFEMRVLICFVLAISVVYGKVAREYWKLFVDREIETTSWWEIIYSIPFQETEKFLFSDFPFSFSWALRTKLIITRIRKRYSTQLLMIPGGKHTQTIVMRF